MRTELMDSLSLEISFSWSSSGRWWQEAEKKNRKQGRGKVMKGHLVSRILMDLKAEQLF